MYVTVTHLVSPGAVMNVDTAAYHASRLPTGTRQHFSKSSACPARVRASGGEAGQCGRYDNASNQCPESRQPVPASLSHSLRHTGQLRLTLDATGSREQQRVITRKQTTDSITKHTSTLPAKNSQQ